MSLANQLRLLSLNFQVLSSTIGQGLVSAIAPVIAWLNALIKRLIQAANAFRTFMWTLFGKPIAAAKGVADDLLGSLDDSADAVGDLGGGAGNAADGLGSAGKAAKELKKQLTVLPFDELNQLAKDTDSASSGGSGGSGGGGGGGAGGLGALDTDSMLPDFEGALNDSPVIQAINRWAARIREAFEKHQWANLGRIVAEGINAGFKFIYDILDWNKIKPVVVDGFITPFQTAFNSMMRWIDWPLIGRTFARGLNDIVYTLRAWITGFEWRNYGTYFAEGLNAMIDGWDANALGRLIADKFKAAWDWFGGFVATFNFTELGTKFKEGVVGFLDELDPADMGQTLAGFFNGLADTAIAMLNDGTVKESLTSGLTEFLDNFSQTFDEEKASHALQLIGDTIIGGIVDALRDADTGELITQLGTVLSSLPWGAIAMVCAAKAGANLATTIFGGLVFKAIAKRLISKSITEALESATLGNVGAGASTGAGASAGTGASAGAGIGLGTVAAGATIFAALLGGGYMLNKYVQKHGGISQYQGQNFAPQYQQPTQQKAVSGQNAAGYNTQLQTAPQVTPSPQASITLPDITEKVKTILFGEKDPSFGKLELAKASLLDTPIVKKIMNGELTTAFVSGYKKFTDTKAYNTIKGFGAKVSSLFSTWWPRNTDTKNYSSTKGMGAKITSLFSTWWPRNIDKRNYSSVKSMGAKASSYFATWWARNIDRRNYSSVKSMGAKASSYFATWWFRNTDQRNYSSVKGMGASISDYFSTWWWRNTDRSNYSSVKGMGASVSDYFYTWWWRLIDRDSYPATKEMSARDAGNFVSFTDTWQGIHDKWVDINVSIVKKTADLGAWIKGKWEELVTFDWFAKGGMFTGPTAISVFGEAGAEAAIPLERKSTMKRIASAIVDSGGMGTSNSDEIADAIAMRVLPAMASMIDSASQRPINNNVTVYTENNEVLARAVNQGNRSLDKRYNPTAQYSY